MGGFDTSAHQFARDCDLLVDDGTEAADGLCTHEFASVDEERGRSVCTDGATCAAVSGDVGFVFATVKCSFELREVQSENFCVADQVAFLEATSVFEQKVVVVPEFALLVCCHCCLCCQVCIFVEAQGLVFESHSDFVAVFLDDLLDGVCTTCTEGAFKVGELDDGHERSAWTSDGGFSDVDKGAFEVSNAFDFCDARGGFVAASESCFDDAILFVSLAAFFECCGSLLPGFICVFVCAISAQHKTKEEPGNGSDN